MKLQHRFNRMFSKIYVLALSLGILILVACTTSPPGPYSYTALPLNGTPGPENAAAEATRYAQEGMNAASTVDAATRYSQATSSAVASATQAAETATAVSATGTAAAQIATATAEIQSIEAADYEARLAFERERDQALFQVTLTAVAEEARTAKELADAEITRQHNLNEETEILMERERNRTSFFKWLPWLIVAFVILVAVLVFLFFLNRERPKEATLPNGMRVSTVWTSDGWRPVALPSQEALSLPPPGTTGGNRAIAIPAIVGNSNVGTGTVTRQPGAVYTPGQRDPVLLPEQLPGGQIGLGVTIERTLWYDIEDLKDSLVAGDKGSGKSTFLRMLAYQAVRQNCEVYFADAELLTFDPADWGPVAQSIPEVVSLLNFILYRVIEERFALFRQASTYMRRFNNGQYIVDTSGRPVTGENGRLVNIFIIDNLGGYNKAAVIFNRMGVATLPALAPALVFWDEANSHMSDSKVMELLHELVRRSRKPGFRLFLASQTWHAKYSPVPIRGRLNGRYAFRTDPTTSQIVLEGSKAASTIPAAWKGHAITLRDDNGRPGRIQGYYLPDNYLFRYISPDRQNSDGHVWIPSSSQNGEQSNGQQAVILPSTTEPQLTQEQLRAQEDAQLILAQSNPEQRFPSRNSVATFLTDGLDNRYAQDRARQALFVLYLTGYTWAGERLGDYLEEMLEESGVVVDLA